MTDTSKLIAEANAISSSSANIKRFAQDAAANLVALAARVAALEPVVPPPPPLPPPNTGIVYTDMAASKLVSQDSTGTNDLNFGAKGPLPPQQHLNPAGFFAAQLYTNTPAGNLVSSDFQIVTDPKYGKVYRLRVGPTGLNGPSRNPYWSDGKTVYAGFDQYRPIGLGTWDWYAFATRWETGYTVNFPWSTIFQFNYPTLSSPPVSVGARLAGAGAELYCSRHWGLVTNHNTAGAQDSSLSIPFASIVGKWVEFIVGVFWDAHDAGEVHILTRCQANGETSFTERLTRTGATTTQWASGNQDNNSITTVDKQDHYFGYNGTPGDYSKFPANNVVSHVGWKRCSDKATALAQFA